MPLGERTLSIAMEVFNLYMSFARKVSSKFVPLIVLSILTILVLTSEALSAGKIVTDTIKSDALKGNKLGDPNTRNMLIYLPPDYDSSDKRYPAIYLLHGFGGNERSFVGAVGEQIAILLIDSMIESGRFKEVIIVMPDGSNKYGGSYYLNSELTGNYEDYIANEIINYIDSKYRTIRDRDGRAIAGASMGGYGSITLAMKHPEIFSVVACLSPPLSFDLIASAVIPEVIKENPNGMTGPRSGKQYSDYIYALSAALSPNLDNPPFFVDLPFEYPGGKIIEPVKQRWLKSDPLTMLSECESSLKAMKGIYIDIGDKDLLGFNDAADAFHQKLLDMGIEHEYNVFQGGHSDRGVERAIIAIEFLSNLLPDPKTPSTVRFKGKFPITWGAIKLR